MNKEIKIPMNVVLALILCVVGYFEPQIRTWVTTGVLPVVQPAPITDEGFRVLILEESQGRDKLSASQREIMLATAPGTVRDYCSARCAKAGSTPEFRLIDKDNADLSRESPVWGKYFSKAVEDAKSPDGQVKLPWIIFGNGTLFKSMALAPDTKAADVLAELEKVGGK